VNLSPPTPSAGRTCGRIRVISIVIRIISTWFFLLAIQTVIVCLCVTCFSSYRRLSDTDLVNLSPPTPSAGRTCGRIRVISIVIRIISTWFFLLAIQTVIVCLCVTCFSSYRRLSDTDLVNLSPPTPSAGRTCGRIGVISIAIGIRKVPHTEWVAILMWVAFAGRTRSPRERDSPL